MMSSNKFTDLSNEEKANLINEILDSCREGESWFTTPEKNKDMILDILGDISWDCLQHYANNDMTKVAVAASLMMRISMSYAYEEGKAAAL
jgi:hypothetical protein